MNIEPNQDLIEKVRLGSLNAFNKLMEMYKNQVYHFCLSILKNKEEAEEVAQDVFVKIFRAIKKFKGESKFTTWMHRITYNECISRIRKNKRIVNQVDITDMSYQISHIENAYENLSNQERSKILEYSLDELDYDSKSIVLMFYYNDKKIEEIAIIMGYSPTNVKTRLFRARKKLLHFFQKKMKLTKNELI